MLFGSYKCFSKVRVVCLPERIFELGSELRDKRKEVPSFLPFFPAPFLFYVILVAF
jgi:hypothetical protein